MSDKTVTSAQSLAAVETMVNMIEENEWAEHVGVCPLTRRLESGITALHNEIAAKNKECEKYETDNQQAVEFLSGQAEGVGELAGDYRKEIWRLRDGINALLNIHTDENNSHILRELRALATSKIEVCPPLKDQKVVGQGYASVFDALIDDPKEREDLKKRSALLRAIKRHVENKYPLSTVEFLRDNVGYSTGLWTSLLQGHIEEFEHEVLLKIVSDIGVELP